MITDADIKKMKTVFATKDDLKSFATKNDLKSLEARMAAKDELKSLNSKMDRGFIEIIEFIGEVKGDIMKELNDFRNEIRDINRNNQSTLNNHESRISHLEYVSKSS
jgi:hypothetical protein